MLCQLMPLVPCPQKPGLPGEVGVGGVRVRCCAVLVVVSVCVVLAVVAVGAKPWVLLTWFFLFVCGGVGEAF